MLKVCIIAVTIGQLRQGSAGLIAVLKAIRVKKKISNPQGFIEMHGRVSFTELEQNSKKKLARCERLLAQLGKIVP